MFQMIAFLIIFVCAFCGCSTSITHVPHESLMPIKDSTKHAGCILVADLGDTRNEDADKVGFGFSLLLPYTYNLENNSGKTTAVSYFLADAIAKDLQFIGYNAKLLSKSGNAATNIVDALSYAKSAQCGHLVTSTVNDAKTNYWGFLVIPFVEPVWTRLNMSLKVYNLKNDNPPQSITIDHSDLEWYYGKLFGIDFLFDAGILGRHWVTSAWGRTVIPEGLAKGVTEINRVITAN